VCRLNLWRMELFKYMKVCQGVRSTLVVTSLTHDFLDLEATDDVSESWSVEK
jgi:hypothetical protein